MPRFFIPSPPLDEVVFEGDEARHIAKSLRTKPGEEIILCDGKGFDYKCIAVSVGEKTVLKVIERCPNISEPSVYLHLYQALPKGSKMEFIIQKAVELGVSEITPVLTSRCIVRLTPEAFEKKRERYQKIAKEAAKQSGRGIIPKVNPLLYYTDALKTLEKDNSIIFYECGGAPLRELVNLEQKQISFFVGSEGGFSLDEINMAEENGAQVASLGSRILRCETAPICAASIFLYLTGNI